MSETEAKSISLFYFFKSVFNFYAQDNIKIPGCTHVLGSSEEKGEKGDTCTESRDIWEPILQWISFVILAVSSYCLLFANDSGNIR